MKKDIVISTLHKSGLLIFILFLFRFPDNWGLKAAFFLFLICLGAAIFLVPFDLEIEMIQKDDTHEKINILSSNGKTVLFRYDPKEPDYIEIPILVGENNCFFERVDFKKTISDIRHMFPDAFNE